MTRHPFRTPTLLLAAVLWLAGCTPSTPAASPSQTPAPADATPSPVPLPTLGVDAASLDGIGIHVWHAFSGPAAALFSQQVFLFNSFNEWGISVIESGYGDHPALFETVNAALENGGTTPALVVSLPEQTLAWDASGQVVDLEPYLHDPQWGLTAAEIADFPAVIWAQDESGGRLGLPAQRSTRVIYYNQTWAQELGFASPPASADEFREQACAANAAFKSDASLQNDGYGGWIVDTDWQAAYSWLLGFGGGVQADESIVFSSDENLAALEFLKGLYDSNCAWLSTETTPYNSFAGRSALFVDGDLAEAWLVGIAMQGAGNTDTWTALPFPGAEEDTLVVYGPSFTVLRSTAEEQLAAWLFARWMVSPENQADWVEATGLLPLRTSSLDLLSDYRSSFPQWSAVVDALPEARGVPQLAGWRQARYVLEDGMIVFFHDNTPLENLPDLLEEMDFMAEDLGK